MERLGKNRGGYFGDRIRIGEEIAACLATARAKGWSVEPLETEEGITLWTLTRGTATAGRRVYLSTGIHGDEPAGPLAVRQLLEEDAWPDECAMYLCPCLNPTGCAGGTRESAAGVDLNRDYRHLRTGEVRAHVAWLDRQPEFDLALCLHEDWESHGFYLYELNPDGRPSLAESMIERVGRVCPIDPSAEIEGRPASGGIIRPSLDPLSRPEWPEAFYLIHGKTRLSYTLEAPSDFTMATRVAALAEAVREALGIAGA